MIQLLPQLSSLLIWVVVVKTDDIAEQPILKCRMQLSQFFPVLAKAINSFSRIGNELYLEATQNGLILRTVNESQTAFAVMNFETGFFTDFKIDRSNSDEYCNKCKVSMKSCLGVFKNTRQVMVLYVCKLRVYAEN